MSIIKQCRGGFVPSIPVDRIGTTPMVPKTQVALPKSSCFGGVISPSFPQGLLATGEGPWWESMSEGVRREQRLLQ